ncbi:MAG: TIGR00289 family protein [Thermoplasmata archaeon]|nr:TIGR00289 family protein [Thermoplasmata archaeon]
MKVAALFSGGKDSIFSIYVAQQYGWDVSYLVSLMPENIDSWMFHGVNIHLTGLLAKALDTPIVSKSTLGEKEKELDDLKSILENLNIDGVISGAISSEYQRTRIEKICHKIGIKSFTPIWHKNQRQLLEEETHAGFKIIIVSVSANGLDKSWLGRTIDKKCIKDLVSLHKKYKINIAGEGGEYETLVLDGPIFKKKITLQDTEIEWKRDYGRLVVKKAVLS